MLLRADYLENQYSRLRANRKILLLISREHSQSGAEPNATLEEKLRKNREELKAVKAALKSIKPK